MGKRVNYELEKEMDKAIAFLSGAITASGHNEKPVILHSIRVGLNLFYLGYSRDIVIGGLLHDVLEDTEENEKNIYVNFGENVWKIVKANTFDLTISDKDERNIDMFQRCKNTGRDALIVKCADVLDNTDFYSLAGSKEVKEMLLKKYNNFLRISEDVIGREPIYGKLNGKVKEISEEYLR